MRSSRAASARSRSATRLRVDADAFALVLEARRASRRARAELARRRGAAARGRPPARPAAARATPPISSRRCSAAAARASASASRARNRSASSRAAPTSAPGARASPCADVAQARREALGHRRHLLGRLARQAHDRRVRLGERAPQRRHLGVQRGAILGGAAQAPAQLVDLLAQHGAGRRRRSAGPLASRASIGANGSWTSA